MATGLQSDATDRVLPRSEARFRGGRVRPDLRHPRGLVIVAGRAIADVELVADDRKPHWVRAEQELAVFDGVKAEVDGEIGSAAAVPAGAMTDLRFETVGAVHLVCWGT